MPAFNQIVEFAFYKILYTNLSYFSTVIFEIIIKKKLRSAGVRFLPLRLLNTVFARVLGNAIQCAHKNTQYPLYLCYISS